MAITLGGFNDIDFTALADAIVASERQPVTQLEKKKIALETQNIAFGGLAGRLATLTTAFQGLGTANSLAGLTVSSSDTGVGATATSGSVAGTYDVIVSQLAKQQVKASTNTYGTLDDVVATSGTLTLSDLDGNDTVIQVNGLTVKQLADAINADDTSPASASVVQTTPGAFQLVLTGKSTGAASAFTIATGAWVGGVTPVFTDKQGALDASFTVNGLLIASSANVVTDAIPGVSLSLLKADPLKTVTVQVASDTAQGTDAINRLVTAYNDLLSFLDVQRNQEIAGSAGISRDPLVRSLRDNLRSGFMAQYTGTGGFKRLAEVGLGFDRTGKMTLDKTIYNAAIKDTPADVQALFSTQGTGSTGAFGALEGLIDSYTDSGGLVADMRLRIDAQVKKMTDRIDIMDARLATRRQALMSEFNAADLVMTRLKSSSNALTSLNNNYKLF
jgi:flagellar hook-associated protein 2